MSTCGKNVPQGYTCNICRLYTLLNNERCMERRNSNGTTIYKLLPIHIIIHTLICMVVVSGLAPPILRGSSSFRGGVSSHHAPSAPEITAGSWIWRSEIMKVYTGKGTQMFLLKTMCCSKNNLHTITSALASSLSYVSMLVSL